MINAEVHTDIRAMSPISPFNVVQCGIALLDEDLIGPGVDRT